MIFVLHVQIEAILTFENIMTIYITISQIKINLHQIPNNIVLPTIQNLFQINNAFANLKYVRTERNTFQHLIYTVPDT